MNMIVPQPLLSVVSIPLTEIDVGDDASCGARYGRTARPGACLPEGGDLRWRSCWTSMATRSG
jgi:hypothetical protein